MRDFETFLLVLDLVIIKMYIIYSYWKKVEGENRAASKI